MFEKSGEDNGNGSVAGTNENWKWQRGWNINDQISPVRTDQTNTLVIHSKILFFIFLGAAKKWAQCGFCWDWGSEICAREISQSGQNRKQVFELARLRTVIKWKDLTSHYVLPVDFVKVCWTSKQQSDYSHGEYNAVPCKLKAEVVKQWKRAHTQLVKGRSVTVASARWATVGRSWRKEGN